MFYTSYSKSSPASALKWCGPVLDNKAILYIYAIPGGAVEILTNNRGEYLKSKLIKDEYI